MKSHSVVFSQRSWGGPWFEDYAQTNWRTHQLSGFPTFFGISSNVVGMATGNCNQRLWKSGSVLEMQRPTGVNPCHLVSGQRTLLSAEEEMSDLMEHCKLKILIFP